MNKLLLLWEDSPNSSVSSLCQCPKQMMHFRRAELTRKAVVSSRTSFLMAFIKSQLFQYSLKASPGQEDNLLKGWQRTSHFPLLPGVCLEAIICSEHSQIHSTRCLRVDPSHMTTALLFNCFFGCSFEVNGNLPKPQGL